jgi:hypothetical protein
MTEGMKYAVQDYEISPICKPRKHVYFDSVHLKPSGQHEEMIFQRNHTFPDGDERRDRIDHNMNLSSQIGHPLTFDLIMWSIVFEDFGNGDDIRQILANMNLGLVLGSQGPLLYSIGSEFYPGLLLTDGFGSEWITARKEPLRAARRNYRRTVKFIRGQVGKASRLGTWTHWYQMLDVNRKARRVSSVDVMEVLVKVGLLNLSAPARLKIGLHGVLYTP